MAFSFAGEERQLVRAVAEAVEKELAAPNVFLDEWFEHYIAGKDADLKLQQIYGERCTLAVICVSKRFGEKPWTKAEHAAVRDRYMKAQTSANERDRLGILLIRVGDGDVDGILLTDIVPDIRQRSLPEAAQLIIDRLRLIHPVSGVETPDVSAWPDQPLPLRWPVADHSAAKAAFDHLLTRSAKYRFLPVRGSTEMGKTQITMQMLGNMLQVPNFACGRFDFKGTTDMDAEVRAFVQSLDVSVPPSNLRLNERLSYILDALKRRARPALLIFDTYEAAGESRDWVEKQLLPSLIRAPWLRVVIAGQRVPELGGSVWEAVASPLIALQPPPMEDWFAFGQQHKQGITIDFVRQAYELCNGKPSVLAELLGPRR